MQFFIFFILQTQSDLVYLVDTKTKFDLFYSYSKLCLFSDEKQTNAS